MKQIKLLLLLCITLATVAAKGGELYSRAFGKEGSPALIFLHGGPGYNSASFELSTAQQLADDGYFVVVYDSRGAGRSSGDGAQYTFDEALKDLKSVYEQYGIKKAGLIGHSFGGAVGIRFAKAYPEYVSKLVLVGAPLDYPYTFRTIIKKCKKYYEEHAPASLAYINMLDTMDTRQAGYSSYCFMHAMQCKLYSPKKKTEEALAISAALKKDSMAKYLAHNSPGPVTGFFKNEAYTTKNFYGDLKEVVRTVPVYGIYGEEDGLFDEGSLGLISDALGKDHFYLIAEASHSVFIDQQGNFIASVEQIMK